MEAVAASNGRVTVKLDDGRYDRQELISWWDQSRLRDARMLVVGAGALGNELVKNLALLGVGTIVVCDLDRVENSNLSRCVLFGEGDEGRPKAQVVAEAAQRLNPEVQVVGVVGDVRRAIGLGVFAAMDVVLGGLDNREARLHTNQCCWKAGVPWVDGAIEGLMGVMRSFVPPHSACYECTLSARDFELLARRRACSLLTREEMLAGKVPTVATTSSVIAGMQAMEAVKLLHDPAGYRFAGQGFVFNGLTHDSYTVSYQRREECLSHDSYELDDALRWSPRRSFGELLDTYGDTATVIELECELAVGWTCGGCGRIDEVCQPLDALGAADAACPACGTTRRPTPTHRLGRAEPQFLERGADALGLAPFDVVTLRDGAQRRLVLIADPEEDPVASLASH